MSLRNSFFKGGKTPPPAPVVTMESESVSETEREYCYYVELADFSQLRNLATKVLDQEQWSFPTNGRGTMRMRKEIEVHVDWEKVEASPIGDYVFEQTLKLWKDSAYTGVSNATEVTFPVDEPTFNAFKQLADNGMIKRRFLVPYEFKLAAGEGEEIKILPAILEVDVFFDSEGNYQPWAKVDVETKAVLNKAPAFPFAVGEVIEPTAEKSVRDNILNTYFLTKK